jgi:3-oxoacyl-[acyl-carrier protein] reductase
MDLGLKDKTAIVCGASQGIGLAVAEALAEEGANVAMFARRREVLVREAERIGALAVRGDVRTPSGSSGGRSRRSAASTSSSTTAAGRHAGPHSR